MRVVQLGPMPPPHGGVSTNMLAIHDALLERGHESTIIDVTNRNGEPASAGVLKPRSSFGLVKMLLSLNCDIVHYHIGGNFNLKLALLTLFCGLLPGKKSVVTFHSGGYARDAADHASPRSIRGVAFRSVDLLIGVNEKMIEMFKSFGVGQERIRLLLPFELKRPDPSVELSTHLKEFTKRFDPLLLSVGALEPEYKNDFLINAMPRVLERFPEAGLLIVGSGSVEPNLKQHVAGLGLEERIMIAGDVEHSIILHLIDRADALLRVTEYDGDSIAIREALYLGTCVIASDNVQRPEGVVHLAWPPQTEDLVQKLIKSQEAQFLDQSDLITEGGNAEKVVEVYKELLSG